MISMNASTLLSYRYYVIQENSHYESCILK